MEKDGIHCTHVRIQHSGSLNVEVKDPRSTLIPNKKKVFEPFRDQQSVLVPLAFQKSIRRDGRAQADVIYVMRDGV